ncbi:Uncharacterised protein [uncultured Leptotrichia sp.]|nr:Uncharacterised protein [uncultured Leptotrichia sp.]
MLLVTLIFSPHPGFVGVGMLASVSTLNIGVFIPSTVISVNGAMSGIVIVVPTPVVLGFPLVPSSIELSVPPYKSVPLFPPLFCTAVVAAEVLYLGSFEESTSVGFPLASTINLEPSVIIPTEPVPVTSIVP